MKSNEIECSKMSMNVKGLTNVKKAFPHVKTLMGRTCVYVHVGMTGKEPSFAEVETFSNQFCIQ